MTIRSNPRLLIFYGILLLLPFGALMLYQNFHPLVGGLLLGASIFIDYKLYGFAKPYISTRVTTSDDYITVYLVRTEETFSWEEITLCGKWTFRGKPILFIYNLEKDRIITVPYEYTNMKDLEKTLKEKTAFEIFSSEVDIRQVIYERFHAGKEKGKEAASQDD